MYIIIIYTGGILSFDYIIRLKLKTLQDKNKAKLILKWLQVICLVWPVPLMYYIVVSLWAWLLRIL